MLELKADCCLHLIHTTLTCPGGMSLLRLLLPHGGNLRNLKKKKNSRNKEKKTLVSAFTSMTSAVLHKSTSTTIVFIIMTTAEALKYMKKSTYSYSMVPDPFLRHGNFFSPTGLHGVTDKKTTKKKLVLPKNNNKRSSTAWSTLLASS